MSCILKQIRSELSELKPYDYDRHSIEGTIWLDHNESPFNCIKECQVDGLNRYPKQRPKDLMEKLASFYQVEPNQLLLTRGSDEGIDLLIRLFCRPFQDSIVICPPTFSMYAFSAILQGATVIEIPLKSDDNFKCDINQIQNQVKVNTKIVFLCSPNNPTGTTMQIRDIQMLCKNLKNTLVVVDEAYIEFAQSESLATMINDFPNLVVLRTFSKMFGMAGLRLGVVIAQKALIEKLQAIMAPYPLSSLVLSMAMQVMQSSLKQMAIQVAYIRQQRKMLIEKLSCLPIVEKIWPSEANFLLIKVKNANRVLEYCAQNQIILRDLSNKKGLENCIRISIGLATHNQFLIKILSECRL